jgi:UDP-N-acetylglucosamine 2-epimerase (non-hydrolysing)
MNECSKQKIMVVIGTRPEATKMGPLIQKLQKCSQYFDTKLVATEQHNEQLYQALDAFNIVPDIKLSVMKRDQTLAYTLSTVVSKLNDLMENDRPDLVIVHGDTQTTLGAALSAYYNKIGLAHVESGLRTYNKYSPWPEEMNRQLVDRLTDIHLAPTSQNRCNLLREGVSSDRIYVTGQTQIDAALAVFRENYVFNSHVLNKIDFTTSRVILVTAHRKENYGKPMQQMFTAIRRLVDRYPDTLVIYPVHLSPFVQKSAREMLSEHERIILIGPLIYQDMINLIARAYLVLSDSGGLQEECPVFSKPLILMRDTTERPEGVEAGITVLAGTDENSIFTQTSRLLTDIDEYNSFRNRRNPFGDGLASDRIINIIEYHFGLAPSLPEEFC